MKTFKALPFKLIFSLLPGLRSGRSMMIQNGNVNEQRMLFKEIIREVPLLNYQIYKIYIKFLNKYLINVNLK